VFNLKSFGGTGFLACARIFAQPGKAVPPIRKTFGKDKFPRGDGFYNYMISIIY
jgi:hypothetical protein